MTDLDQYSQHLIRGINTDSKNPSLPRMLYHHLIREGCSEKGVFVVIDTINYDFPGPESTEFPWDVNASVSVFLETEKVKDYLSQRITLLKAKIDDEGGASAFSNDEAADEDFSKNMEEAEQMIEAQNYSEGLTELNTWLEEFFPDNNYKIEIFDIIPE